jgi:hypothetical protein
MQSLGAAHVVMLLVLVVLAFDSRRLHALARSTARARRDPQPGIPPGANPDQVGLPLRQIQMRIHVDWQDGGIGWDGPEVLPADEVDDATVLADATPEALTSQALPVLWNPFRALAAGDRPRGAAA